MKKRLLMFLSLVMILSVCISFVSCENASIEEIVDLIGSDGMDGSTTGTAESSTPTSEVSGSESSTPTSETSEPESSTPTSEPEDTTEPLTPTSETGEILLPPQVF